MPFVGNMQQGFSEDPTAAICRYDNQGGASMTAVKLSDQRGTGGGRSDRRCTISAVKDEALGANGQPAYIQVEHFLLFTSQA